MIILYNLEEHINVFTKGVKMYNSRKFPAIILILVLFLFVGCEKKVEKPITQTDTTKGQVDTITANGKVDSTAIKDSIAKAQQLVGTWSGSFEGRNATLKITQQNGDEFKGNISIKYREAINQQVSGKIDREKKRFTMRDLAHARTMGTYSGKLNDDFTKMSGTFTMTAEKTSVSFNLSKKK